MTAPDDVLSRWNPMEEDYRNDSFNCYSKGPGRDIPKVQDRTSGLLQVFVNNIPIELTEEGLTNQFRVGGCSPLAVKKCRPKIPSSESTFGFVTYATVKECETAIQRLNGFKVGKYNLNVVMARPPEQQQKHASTMGLRNETKSSYTTYSKSSATYIGSGMPSRPSSEVASSGLYKNVDMERAPPTVQSNVKTAGRGFMMNMLMDSVKGAGDTSGINGSSSGRPGQQESITTSTLGGLRPNLQGGDSPSNGSHGLLRNIDQTAESLVTKMPAGAGGGLLGPQLHEDFSISCAGIKASSPIEAAEAVCAVDKVPVSPSRKVCPGTVSNESVCSACRRTGNMKCGRCKQPYCSKQCQQADWPRHSKVCHQLALERQFESEFEITINGKALSEENDEIDLCASYLPTASVSTGLKHLAADLATCQLIPGKEYCAEVSSFCNPSQFSVQLVDESGNTKKARLDFAQHLDKSLRSVADSLKEYKPIVGELCAAKYSGDNRWYRAAIKKVDASTVTLCYIDYGNEETLKFSSIRPIAAEFVEFPKQAVLCALADVKAAADGMWPLETVSACARAGLHLYEPLAITCVSTNKGDQPAKVKVTVKGADLGEQLKKAGLAISATPERHIITRSLQDEFIPDETIKVFVTSESIVSPDEFSAQIFNIRHASILAAWKTMSEKLSQSSQHLPSLPTGYQFQVGDYVQAQFAGAWYRARVLRVFEANSHVELFYVDYGNVDQQLTCNVLPLAAEFADVPCMACTCSLICSASGKAKQLGQWPTQWVQAMSTAVANAAHFDGIIKGKDAVTGRLVLEVPALAAAVDSAGMLSPLFVSTRSDTAMSDEKMKSIPNCPDGSKYLPVSSTAKVAKETREQATGTCRQVSCLPSSTLDTGNGKVVAIVTFVSVEIPGLFYIQANSPESKSYFEMVQKWQELATQSGPIDKAGIAIGQVLLASCTDDRSWCRGRVEEIYTSKGEVRVYYPDFGNNEVLPISSLRSLPAEYCLLPAQATTCRLRGVEGLSPKAVCDQLMAHRMKKIFVQVVGRDSSDKDVRLVEVYLEDGLHVNQQLKVQRHTLLASQQGRNELAVSLVPSTEVVSKFLQKPSERHRTMADKFSYIIPQKDDFSVLVTHIISPKHFFGQYPNEDLKKLDKVMHGFSAETYQPLDDWIVGEVVVAKWHEDESWYRGVVTSLRSSCATISFVDFGNEAEVEHCNIRLPTADLQEIPFQAVQMSLSSTVPDGITMDDQAYASQRFKQLTTNTLLTAHVVQRKTGQLIVSLRSSSCDDIGKALLPPKPMPLGPVYTAMSKNVAEEKRQLLADIAIAQKHLEALHVRLLQLDMST